MKAYNTPNCIMSEFEEDLNRIKYINRLLKRYKTTGELKERLILNHIIVLSNVFGIEFAVRMMFFKIPDTYPDTLKTFLTFLRYMPDTVKHINGTDIISMNIPIDLFVLNTLRNIKIYPTLPAGPPWECATAMRIPASAHS